MLELKHISKTFFPGTVNAKTALDDLSLILHDGDFVTVIGGNGAGKSTMLNAVAGTLTVDSGTILLDGEDITHKPEHRRAADLGRVFQDPMMGTAGDMWIEENLALAARRGSRRTFKWGISRTEREQYRTLLAPLGLGPEDRLTTKMELLSGGQRQALTLLMASLKKPKLLLDEHTAALDPKTAAKVLELSDRVVAENGLILSFCELAAGGRNGLDPVEKTVIDRAVRIVYRPYIADPRPENMPLLEDLYDEIKRQPEPEAQRIAAALELYVYGSLNVFNHRTNVDINNRIVCFDIKELGKQLKSLGMLVIQDQVWNRVSQNRDQGKSTWYFVDEFHLLLRGEVGSWSVEIWKRFRKWGGIPTGITQNIKDLLSSPEIENIFENSDFVYLLNQASGDRKILCERLNISNQQAAHISNAGPGEGLIFFGNVILPFVDDFPKDNELYSIMTTKLGETGKGENEHE